MLLLLMMRCSVEMFLLHQLPGRVLLKVLFVRPFVLLEISVPDAGLVPGRGLARCRVVLLEVSEG